MVSCSFPSASITAVPAFQKSGIKMRLWSKYIVRPLSKSTSWDTAHTARELFLFPGNREQFFRFPAVYDERLFRQYMLSGKAVLSLRMDNAYC